MKGVEVGWREHVIGLDEEESGGVGGVRVVEMGEWVFEIEVHGEGEKGRC